MTQEMTAPRNSLALASVILGGIVAGLGLLFGLLGYAPDPLRIAIFAGLTSLPALLAIIFGFVGISTANRLEGRRRGLAIAGVILGFLPVPLLLGSALLRAAVLGA